MVPESAMAPGRKDVLENLELAHRSVARPALWIPQAREKSSAHMHWERQRRGGCYTLLSRREQKERRLRVISARDMHRKERMIYEEKFQSDSQNSRLTRRN